MVRPMSQKSAQPHAAGAAPDAPSASGAPRQRLVNDVFDKVAGRYDLMNDLMSGGLHRVWKSLMIDWLAPPRSARPFSVLDVAGGTGDIAFRIAERSGAGTRITVCDINANMARAGAERARAHDQGEKVSFMTGNAEALPARDQSFDACTIAFGIRNVPDIARALREAYRVLRPGGRYLCLEFSHVDIPFMDALYAYYSDRIIPKMGAVVVGDAAPYRYLVDSIRTFPEREAFAAMIGEAGFSRVRTRVLSGGIVALHSGWRL